MMFRCNELCFAWRLFKRDWRAGELRLLTLALVVAVAAVSSVGFFIDRIDRAMIYQAAELLAADMQLQSRKPIPDEFQQRAQQQGLQTAGTASFSTVVVSSNEETVLAEIKAVTEGYPLRGELKISESSSGTQQFTKAIPAMGEIWVEPRLLTQLQVVQGDYLYLGEARLRITEIIVHEPDRGGNIWQFGPRILMNYADLAVTQLLGPLSRIRYGLLLAGEASQLEVYRAWAEAEVDDNINVRTVEDARPEIRRALERARQFLGLAVIVAVMLAGAAIAVSARHFSARQINASALLKCLGAEQGFISRVFIWRMLMLALLASVAGTILGFGVQQALAELLQGWFVANLPSAGGQPVLLGIVTGFVVLLGFAVPPLLRLKQVPPLRAIRQELMPPPLSARIMFSMALLAMVVLIYWQARDVWLAVYVLLGTVSAILLSAIAAGLLLKVVHYLPRSGAAWRYGLSNLLRRSGMSRLQLIAFSLSIMALMLLTLVRIDLLQSWEKQLPPDLPNHFLINIQPAETEALAAFFATYNLPPPSLGPVVTGRMTMLNGQALNADDYSTERAKWIIEREQRLSYREDLPDSNRITAGRFWDAQNQHVPQWSLEASYAEGLGIKVGDHLGFMVGGHEIAAPITSIREIDWDSMQVNFFVLGTPALLQAMPQNYLASFYLPAEKENFIARLIRSFPGISVLDVRAIITQVRAIMTRASQAIEYIFVFTLIACLLVLYATINASREVRRQEAALLRALGASRRRVLSGFAVEFFTLGSLAGLLGALLAGIVGYFVATEVFQLQYRFNMGLMVAGMSLGGIAIGIAGLLGTYRLTTEAPMRALTVSAL